MAGPCAVQVCGVEGGAVEVIVTGELDMSCASDLFAAVITASGLPDVQEVVVDLGGIGFMDSSGLAALIKAQQKLAGDGQSLRVSSASRPAAMLFEITDTTTLFTSPVTSTD